ncbi:MAG TPA: hypothetical protein VMR65_02395 [Candidatus Sulfotelmatobacter sp.]|nr:hypothetical protein [Candidatus Sulfotelmatobacter sp.]
MSAVLPLGAPLLALAALAGPLRVAVLPVENLTGRVLDGAPIERAWRGALAASGMEVLDDPTRGALMDRHRVRYVGGVSPDLATAFREEAQVQAVMITSVERWIEHAPPVLSLHARLVSTEAEPSILWVGGLGATGEDHPGFLGLGVVDDPKVLLARVVADLAASVKGAVSGGASRTPSGERRFRPKLAFASVVAGEEGGSLRVAVLPFTNRTDRRRGGDLVAAHFVAALAGRPGIRVVEPGIVREVLLKLRVIPEGGIPYAQAELLRETLGADLVLMGEVLDYSDADVDGPPPIVDFTVQALDAAHRRVAWSAFSHSTGTDGVWFFERGRLRTAHALAAAMARSAVEALLTAKGKP